MKGADGVVHAEDRVGGFFFCFFGPKNALFYRRFCEPKSGSFEASKIEFCFFFLNKMGVLPSWGLG